MTTLKILRLTDTAIVPYYATAGAAGIDLHADLLGPGAGVCYRPGSWYSIGTGIAVQLPPGHEGQVRGRSGMAFRDGVEFYVGTIDADYVGEIKVLLRPGRELKVYHGDRIAQLVIAPVARCEVVEVEQLSETQRGAGGFGHTGAR